MRELVEELLAFVEADAKRWEEAAKQCEGVAEKLSPSDRAQWLLMCAVFNEHAGLHRKMLARMRERLNS